MKKGGTSEEMQTTCHILYYATFKSPLQISCHLNPPPQKKTNKKNNPETSSTPGHILQSPVPLLPDSCLQAAATWHAPWKVEGRASTLWRVHRKGGERFFPSRTEAALRPTRLSGCFPYHIASLALAHCTRVALKVRTSLKA